ncbi:MULTISPECIES: ABC transporter permease [Fusobacterium]|jgi:NitT/TauT family transport system permease protein|uniref:ABC transporter permease n=1 Tax=Fusobacterium TaxID=848 RepID=UPI0012B219BC|nr:ABC transporter permease subunit [Fusobacterium sp. FSA-380-WT-2B]MSS60343.1 ABC transporter permease subunit [Fusobacterium sp. FSA-380-WT-2B]
MKRFMQNSPKFLSMFFFFIIWEGVALYIDNSLLFPRVSEIFLSLKNLVASGDFTLILWNTLSRFFISIVFSLILAIIFSVASYRYEVIGFLLFPFIIFLRAVPTIAIIIVVLIWSSVERVPIVVGMLILFPILYESILGGIKNVDKNLLKMSKVFKVPTKRVVRDIYIPSIYYSISSNIPSYIGLTFKVIIAGEVLSQESLSIGGEIFINKIYLESSNIFAWIIVVIVLNYLLEKGLKTINSRVCRWEK